MVFKFEKHLTNMEMEYCPFPKRPKVHHFLTTSLLTFLTSTQLLKLFCRRHGNKEERLQSMNSEYQGGGWEKTMESFAALLCLQARYIMIGYARKRVGATP